MAAGFSRWASQESGSKTTASSSNYVHSQIFDGSEPHTWRFSGISHRL